MSSDAVAVLIRQKHVVGTVETHAERIEAGRSVMFNWSRVLILEPSSLQLSDSKR
jgi:hypothetical protein